MPACSRTPRPPERIVLLPFDNLTGDPSLDWVGSAAPTIVAGQLTGASRVFAARANALRDAYAANAARFVHGYFDRRHESLHFEISIEDSALHKMVRTEALAGDVLSVSNALARIIDPTAHRFSTANPEAVAAWGQGDFERAVSLDPDFSAAWVSWVETRIAGGDPKQALDIAGRALARPALYSPVDRAQLELLSAGLRGDNHAREQAVLALARLNPNDSALMRSTAESEMRARRFPEAVNLYQEAARLEPGETAAQNLLGYAQALVGDLKGARKSFEQYGKESGDQANALDSMGEALFLHGQFAEAEKNFLASGAKDRARSFEELQKAAYARWLQGDLPKADALFAQAIQTRANDPLVPWRQAVWEYSTGRRDRALERMERESGPAAQVARQQLAVWRDPNSIPSDLAVLKQRYEQALPPNDGLVRTLYAAALLQAGRKQEARELIALWPLPDARGDELLQASLYPTYLDVKTKLK